MKTEKNPTSILRSILVGAFAILALYVLSFGPICHLSAAKLAPDATGHGVHLASRAKFPSWGRWTQVGYRPLFAILGGHAGRLPKQILFWYVNLWG
jgi:hypothetical protein